jgi:hypothetical protein
MQATLDFDDSALTHRRALLSQRESLHAQAVEMATEAQTLAASSPERGVLYRGVQDRHAAKAHLETVLANGFLPAHGAGQLISPRIFFVSPLFRVASKRLERERTLSLALKTSEGGVLLSYSGPELRQSDGLVFMALLNHAKDDRVGTKVRFSAEELCKKTFGRYDGPSRKLLHTHIQRLQRGLLEFETFSVQLCKRFDYPARGEWAVELDPDIVKVFQHSSEIWLDMPKRKALPEGLTTWLYGFIESQTRLIPLQARALRDMCGSEASEESFLRTLRIALKELASHGIIDPGWRVQGGQVFWMKR